MIQHELIKLRADLKAEVSKNYASMTKTTRAYNLECAICWVNRDEVSVYREMSVSDNYKIEFEPHILRACAD